jgi:hypothetical protein
VHPELEAPANLGKVNSALKLRNAQGKLVRANEVRKVRVVNEIDKQ